MVLLGLRCAESKVGQRIVAWGRQVQQLTKLLATLPCDLPQSLWGWFGSLPSERMATHLRGDKPGWLPRHTWSKPPSTSSKMANVGSSCHFGLQDHSGLFDWELWYGTEKCISISPHIAAPSGNCTKHSKKQVTKMCCQFTKVLQSFLANEEPGRPKKLCSS